MTIKKAAFIGTVMSSYEALEELLENQVGITGVFTLDKAYSKGVSDYADLKPLCERFFVPYYTFRNVNDEHVIHKLRIMAPDYIFVIGLSQLVKREILDLPPLGCIGAHPSLLPKGRGRASLPWAIINEDKISGMSVFYLEEGADSGAIISQRQFTIHPNETSKTLYNKAVCSLRDILKEIAPHVKKGTVSATPQSENLATYTTKRIPTDGFINWETMSTHEIDRLIRATTYPYPGAYTYYKKKKLIIWEASIVKSTEFIAIPGQILKVTESQTVWIKTIDGVLELKEVSYEGNNGISGDFISLIGYKLGINLAELIEELLS
ncbi:methionyl-tRNA formyltransferase [Bacillus sp. DTU_2020_1000418_1_SI_GHA_SEK_038]|uniref:methionyl-tRNA formyltransferase n=1 Tax=Bacillus sp. DTU_2020_1000418_1_SI_GHA_SEK_038 TaxID=3077585 RepID=UPI0028EFAC83|nr:methionyl-tRNA formyltransferase [Bacillus sp. DTU_2020_1000418_1_SI_GHA_SEK_038]WNS74813.1 methionyl-tRNA formyltransferase [Bacillus sp. DTU_2020_1000418_1_SI_GHA_SEK_038]